MMRFLRPNLSVSLASILALAGAAFAGLLVFNALHQQNLLVQDARQNLESAAREAGSDFNELLEEGRGVLNALVAAPAVRAGEGVCSAVLDRTARATRLRDIVRFDATGRGLCGSVANAPGLQVGDRAYFQAARSADDFVLSEPLRGRNDGERIMVLAKPVTRDGRFTGVLAASFSIRTATSVAGRADRLPGTSIVILDRFGDVLVTTGNRDRASGLSDAVRDVVLSLGGGNERVGDADRAVVIGFAPLFDVIAGPFAVVRAPEDVITARAWANTRRMLAIGAAVLLLALGTAYAVLRRQVVQPVGELLTATDELARGAYERARVHLQGGRGEFATLRARLHALGGTLAAREQDLRATSQRLSAVVENLPQGVCVLDAEQQLIAVNDAFAEHFVLSRSQIQPGQDLRRVFDAAAAISDRRDGHPIGGLGAWRSAAQRGEARSVEIMTRHNRALALEGRTLSDGGYLISTSDVTERKRLAETYAAFFDNAARRDIGLPARIDALLEIGRRHFELPVAIVARVDGDAYEVLNAAASAGEPAPPAGSVLPLSQMYCATAIERARPVAFDHAAIEGWTEHPCYRRFGVEAYIGAPVYVGDELYGALNFHSRRPADRRFGDSDVQVLRLLAQWLGSEIERDRNLRRLAANQAEIAEQRAYLQAVVDATNDAIAPVDHAGTIVSVNPAMQRMFAASEADLIGRHLSQLVDPQERDAVTAAVNDRHAGVTGAEGTRHMDSRGVRADGTRFPIEIDLSPMALGDRSLTLAVLKDASARRQAEEIKNQFVSMVSHELRTPLTSIIGSLGLVRGGAAGALPARAAALTDMAYRNANRLIGLVNDILDFERLRSGRLEIRLQDVELADQLTEAARHNAGYAEQAGCALDVETRANLTVRADPDRLQQVLANLISNAAKFSPEGAAVTLTGDKASDGEAALITVRDRGPGLPESVRDRLFEPFVQADPSDARKQQKGTGLGLAITRSLLAHMGGTVHVESVPGDTRFHVTLPLARAEPAADASNTLRSGT